MSTRNGLSLLALAGGMALTAVAGTGAARADLLVGVAGPMTGQYASFGEQLRQGTEAAIADINAKGGVNGQKLVMTVGDDVCDPRQAVSVANQFAKSGVAFVNGHFCSGSTLPASEIYNEEGIPEITVSSNPKITERGFKGLFRITGRDDQQGAVIADHIAKTMAGKKVALVHDKSAFGKGLVDNVREALKAHKITPEFEEAITAGERDYSALVAKLASSGVEAVAFGGYHTELGLILRQITDAGKKIAFISGDPSATTELWSIAGPAAEGLLFTFPPDPRKMPGAAETAKRFRDKGIEPEGYVLYSYAAVQAFADAVAKGKGSDGKTVAKTLHEQGADTILGPVKFDAKGDNVVPGYVVYRWSNGTFDYLK